MLRRTALAAASLLAAGALLLTACTGSPTPSPSATSEPDPDASAVIRLVLEPGNLDIRQTAGSALDQILVDNVYQGLVARTPEQEIVPALASDWTISDDGLTYTFTLQEGVTFHDGQELTPQDVVWSLRPARTPPEWRDSARLANVDSITADGQDITLTLTEPDSSLLWNLTGRAGLILKQDDTVDYQTAANGTGPYVLTDWLQGDSITFARNEDYWGDKAQVAEVVFDYIPDRPGGPECGARRRGGRAHRVRRQPEGPDRGERRLHRSSSASPPTRARSRSTRPAVRSPTSGCGRRSGRRSTTTRSSRRSASGQTQYGPIPELDPGYEDLSDVAPFDPEAAKALLADAGVEDLTLTLTIPNFYSTTIPQILVSNLNDVGITLEVDSVDFSTWLNDVYSTRTTTCRSCCTPRRATSRTGRTPTTTSPTTTPRCRTCTRSRSRRPTKMRPQSCSSRRPASSPRTPAPTGSTTAPRSSPSARHHRHADHQRQRAPQPRRARQERRVIRYTLTRLALLLLGLLVASVLIFLTLRVLPGDVAQLIAGVNSTPEQVEAIRQRLGLDQPLPAQYLDWIGGVFRGDLGNSLLTGSSVGRRARAEERA